MFLYTKLATYLNLKQCGYNRLIPDTVRPDLVWYKNCSLSVSADVFTAFTLIEPSTPSGRLHSHEFNEFGSSVSGIRANWQKD